MRRSLSREHRVALVLWLLIMSLLGAACANKPAPHALLTPSGLPQSTASPSTQVVSPLVFITGYTVNQPPASTTEYFVAALNADDGPVRWRYLSQTSTIQPLAVTGQTVYIQQQTDLITQPSVTTLVALNAESGAVRWIFTATPQFTLAPSGDTVYVGMYDPATNGNTGAIAALNAATGAVKWQTAVNGCPGAPTVSGNTVLLVGYGVGGQQGSLYALDTASGQVRWQSGPRTSLSGMLTAGQNGCASAPLVLGNLVLATTSASASGQEHFSIIAYGVTDGHVRWQVQPGQQQSRTTAYGTVSDGQVVYLAYSAVPTSPPATAIPKYDVEALGAGDGSTLWQTPISYLPSPPVLAGGSIFLMEPGGLPTASPPDLLIALDAHSGAVQWHLPSRVDNVLDGVPVVDGNVVCIPTWIPAAASTPAVTPNPSNPQVIALAAYNMTTGKETWRTTLDPTHLPQPPVVDGDTLLVRFNANFLPLVAIRAADGHVLWRFGGADSTVTWVMPDM